MLSSLNQPRSLVPSPLQLPPPFPWYCWRALQPAALSRVAGQLDVDWAFVVLTPVAPNVCIAAAHAIADCACAWPAGSSVGNLAGHEQVLQRRTGPRAHGLAKMEPG